MAELPPAESHPLIDPFVAHLIMAKRLAEVEKQAFRRSASANPQDLAARIQVRLDDFGRETDAVPTGTILSVTGEGIVTLGNIPTSRPYGIGKHQRLIGAFVAVRAVPPVVESFQNTSRRQIAHKLGLVVSMRDIRVVDEALFTEERAETAFIRTSSDFRIRIVSS